MGRLRAFGGGWRLAAAAAALAVLPLLVSQFWLNVLVLILFASIGAQAMNFLTGVVGQVSVGNAAFMSIGAVVAYQVHDLLQAGAVVAVLAAGAAAALLGSLASLPAFRLRGFYLALSTIALVIVLGYLLQMLQVAQVGVSGYSMPRAAVLGYEIRSDTAWFYLIGACVAGTTFAFVKVTSGPFGRAAAVVREREGIAPALGIHPRRIKAYAFIATSAIVGIQGALFAYYVGFFAVEQFTLLLSIQYLAMPIIGGLRHPAGALLGAAFVVGIPFAIAELARWSVLSGLLKAQANNIALLIYGLSLVVILLVFPKGLVGISHAAAGYLRAKARPKC